MMTSPAHGQEKDSYTLRWHVESYAPIEEYKVTYKIAQVGGPTYRRRGTADATADSIMG